MRTFPSALGEHNAPSVAENGGRKILVCVDGSGGGDRALAHSLYMLLCSAVDTLLLLHVVEGVDPNNSPSTSGNIRTTSTALVTSARNDNALSIIDEYNAASKTQVSWERKTIYAADARTAIVK
jgi:hypothetical protein